MKKKNNPWLQDEIDLLIKYYNNNDKLVKLIPTHSINSINSMRKKLGLLRTRSHENYNWSNKEIKIIRKYYPLMGNSNPKFHQSLQELLPKPIERKHIVNFVKKNGIKVDPQKGTKSNEKRCTTCLRVKNLSNFFKNSDSVTSIKRTKGVTSSCRICVSKTDKKRRLNIDNNYIDRIRLHLRREGKKYSTKYLEDLWEEIQKNIGLPQKCFFDDKYCGDVTQNTKLFFLFNLVI